MTKLSRQRGMTFFGLIIMLGLLAFFVLVGLRLFPLYNESFQVYSGMKAVASMPDISKMNDHDIQKYLEHNFEVNDLNRFTDNNLGQFFKVSRIKNSKNRLMTMTYEDRRPLIANLDVVLKFNKSIEIPGDSNE